MAKIVITEKYNSSTNESTSNIVYFPVKCATSITSNVAISKVTNGTELTAYFTKCGITETTGNSYKICKHLIELGMTLLLEGLSGSNAPSWTSLKDKRLYDVKFLTTGIDYVSDTLATGAITCAKSRGDCIALVDLNEKDWTTTNYAIDTIKALYASVTDGEHATCFTPWVKTTTTGTTSSDDYIPASFAYLFKYARNVLNGNDEGMPVAGYANGEVEEVTELKHEYTTAEIEQLQARIDDSDDNPFGTFSGIAINPIVKNPNISDTEFIIWGNRTMRVEDGDLTSTSFLNNMITASNINKLWYKACMLHAFEQTGNILWSNLVMEVSPTLDKLKSSGIILDYKVRQVATTKKARVCGLCTFTPVEGAEDFKIDVVVTDTVEVTE